MFVMMYNKGSRQQSNQPRTKVIPKSDVENQQSKGSVESDDLSLDQIMNWNAGKKEKNSAADFSSKGSVESDLDIDEDELEKLVPVLLEDASDGNVEAVRQVLEIDAQTPNFSIAFQVDGEKRNALHRASLEGRFEVLKLLLKRFQDTNEPKTGIKYIDVPDKYGNTALFLVCIRLDKSDFMQAKYLLDAGASVDVVKMSDAMTVLHWAAHHGNQELVHELLMHQKKKEKEREKEKKQNPTQQQQPALKLAYLLDKDHRTPIDIAGLQYEKKWSEEDDALRGDSLISDKSQVSSMNDFAATIRNLSNPSLLPNDPTNDYWHRCLFWCAAIGHRTGVEDALRRGGRPRWQVHRHI